MIILINRSMSYECVRPMTNGSDALLAAIEVYHDYVKYTCILKQF